MSEHDEASTRATAIQSSPRLARELGLFGATMMGLGSIIGTGVFVSIAIAAGVAGPAVLLSIVVAAAVAACNGLSSAQLAANHPVSGGSYEYGYRWLHPSLGFTAGWMFVCAKTASGATAALGFAGYAMAAFGADQADWQIPLAIAAVVLLTVLVLGGIRRSSQTNIAIVSVTLLSLGVFIVAGVPTVLATGTKNLTPFFAPVSVGTSVWAGVLQACALMFVAYTGYGRIATLAEEVREPRRTIPVAIVVTLLVSMTIYLLVGLVAVTTVGASQFAGVAGEQAAPLEMVADRLRFRPAATIVAIGAVTAMLGVLLNLVLGVSRVVLAMGRRHDLPSYFANVSGATSTPSRAVVLVGILMAGLVLIGDVKTTWSFSAFTVLIYYAITNLAATRLSDQERLYPRVIPWLGLLACLFLAFWVESRIWMVGLSLIAAGLMWHWAAQRLSRRSL